jgi:nicotinate-nucleotide pyrophosphorylase (carboxylating)
MADLPEGAIGEIVRRALEEDVGAGDITTLATVAAEARCRAQIVAKAEGVVAGLSVAEAVFRALDPEVSFEHRAREGDGVRPGMAVAEAEGRARAMLMGERTALNFLQRMSGIATLTARFVAAVQGTKAKILDTRKTAPGLRLLDKAAVRAGGGQNHRMGLFDGVLIKDNHIRAAGGIAAAVERARARTDGLSRIEVEAQTLAQVEEVLAAGADSIMLDNMSLEEIGRAVGLIAGRAETEVSGGVTLATVRAYAEVGVDYISVGALTHSAPALDFSLEIVEQ